VVERLVVQEPAGFSLDGEVWGLVGFGGIQAYKCGAVLRACRSAC
jgi:hypothetical protein